MPGPRNPKRQKKLDALKERKRKGSPVCKVEVVPVATPEVDGDVRPADSVPHVEEKDAAIATNVEQEIELDEVGGETLLREPPIYDPGTGPRVKSMDEFLRSSFASEPTWEDELCAEFGQEEMLEMLRTVLPDEMALVSAELYIMGSSASVIWGLTWAVMKVRVVQQKSTMFARLSGVLEDFPDGGCSSESTQRPQFAQDSAQGLSRIGGRAGDQRTL